MNDVVIVAAGRTAVGKFGGRLSQVPATALGAHVIRHLVASSGIDRDTIDEVIMGQVLAAGCGQNPARQAAIGAGLADMIPAYTINKVCGSGLKAVQLAAQSIKCGDAQIVIAGGQENMSAAPQVVHNIRDDIRMEVARPVNTMIIDGLWDAYNHYHMGVTAENIATRFAISRMEQDEFALFSQQKAETAQKEGRFRAEIIPLEFQTNTGNIVVDTDEHPRHGMTLAALTALKPAFSENGSVTAGNASGINDGAAAVILMSAQKADELGLKPMARIKAYSSAGVDPAYMGMGPVPAAHLCLKKAGWSHHDVDLMEINEAFAAQAIAVNREMGWDTEKIDVNGGAIALGHPIGASGCRILVTLIHEMIRRDVRRGLASLCIGGGMGVALAIER